MLTAEEMMHRVEEARYAMVAGNDMGEMIPPGDVDHWLDYILGIEREEPSDDWFILGDSDSV